MFVYKEEIKTTNTYYTIIYRTMWKLLCIRVCRYERGQS